MVAVHLHEREGGCPRPTLEITWPGYAGDSGSNTVIQCGRDKAETAPCAAFSNLEIVS